MKDFETKDLMSWDITRKRIHKKIYFLLGRMAVPWLTISKELSKRLNKKVALEKMETAQVQLYGAINRLKIIWKCSYLCLI